MNPFNNIQPSSQPHTDNSVSTEPERLQSSDNKLEKSFGYRQVKKNAPEKYYLDASNKLSRLNNPVHSKPFKIITPDFATTGKTNCHGFTLHKELSASTGAGELLLDAGKDDKIAIFTDSGLITHSGLYNESGLLHYVMGVGVILSEVSENDSFDYDQRFNLPEDRNNLDKWLQESGNTQTRVVRPMPPELRKLLGYE
ncbi:hypothetical protein EOPP23_12965 [Endozoicomonas sp. OPT23]|uniref:hypothetical protein n=1 Tax=Endozoicomonas sp. OPT23 TaxID=2072845 RepID=UPI00129BB159|nr:hypothetical protein [Endozoicomonas sp. OPT23]MRI33899.1 hypothetical protein [Endozoicomonas sp. OPT23]